MKTVDNCLKFQADNTAQFRYRCLLIFETQGLTGVKLAFPGVSSRSLSRWRNSYLKSGKKLSSLQPKSTRPNRCRQMVIPIKILSFLKAIRQQHPNLSKYKLKIFLDEFCLQEGLDTFSTSWIGKVIKRNSFFFANRGIIRRKQKTGNKSRVLYCPKADKINLGYLQVDGVKVVWEGQTLYFFCALEIVSRQAFVKRVINPSSLQAKLFLEEIKTKIDYQIHTVQTDNGSEFEKYFDQTLKELIISHLWSRPHSPKVNGFVERFNGILQQEFINYYLDLGMTDKSLFDQKLAEWLVYYNTRRPHHSLHLKTPYQKLLELEQMKKSQSAICV
jgi:hypothetical protein